MKQVYFDNAATTQIREEVIDVMTLVMKKTYGNASSSHSYGRSAKAIIEQSRKKIASFFNVSAGEIIFTSGGTEADNLVLRSAVRDLGVKHIITSRIEHHGVLHTIDALIKEYNILVTYLNIDVNGDVDIDQLEGVLKSNDKVLVSLMHVNNEIGNILDIKRVADLCKTNNALFHSDAVQSIGHYKLDLQTVKVDFIAASAHKFHGPKGIGFAFVRKNTGLKPITLGGEQERGLRAGTESIHNIVGLEKALSMAYDNFSIEYNYVKNLKAYFVNKISNTIPNVSFNGNSASLITSTYALVNVCLPISLKKSAMLLFQLDLKGVACSKGSACQSGSSQKSHVLYELLSKADLEKPSIRFSFSIYNTLEDVDYLISVLKEFISS